MYAEPISLRLPPSRLQGRKKMLDMTFSKTAEDRLETFCGIHIANESNKLPGHKERMLAHFKRIHQAMKPFLFYDGYDIKACNCGICKPRKNFNWDRLAENLIA